MTYPTCNWSWAHHCRMRHRACKAYREQAAWRQFQLTNTSRGPFGNQTWLAWRLNQVFLVSKNHGTFMNMFYLKEKITPAFRILCKWCRPSVSSKARVRLLEANSLNLEIILYGWYGAFNPQRRPPSRSSPSIYIYIPSCPYIAYKHNAMRYHENSNIPH